MNRPRKKSFLVATTSDDVNKKAIARNNRRKKITYVMNVFGKQKRITEEQYYRLKNAGMNVEKMTE